LELKKKCVKRPSLRYFGDAQYSQKVITDLLTDLFTQVIKFYKALKKCNLKIIILINSIVYCCRMNKNSTLGITTYRDLVSYLTL
jgi:hypothetical protein